MSKGKRANIWIREENLKLWDELPNKSQFVNDTLDRLRALLDGANGDNTDRGTGSDS